MRAKFFFICSTYSPVVRLTACHIKMHYIYIYLFISLFICLFTYLKSIFTKLKLFQWFSVAVWEKEALSERLEPITNLCHLSSIY